ncbi:hypothetical protein BKA63DRAFT_229909 [Paraphoma chrysanthemicola]|nr:hypothetical protein BKA63DRAFT_229909 [Paraphoma chrysanthemicola]
MAIEPVFNRFASRPKTASSRRPLVNNHTLIRDQLSILTWLVIGATIQGLAHLLLPYRNIALVLPVLLFLSYKLLTTILILTGFVTNPYMSSVLPYRTAIIYPDSSGAQSAPGTQPICAIMLSAISNHPLGIFGPGFKEVSDRFDAMTAQLSADATRYGFLGATSWVNACERTTGNEFATIMYFENEEYVHAYAHGEMHTETMQWWHKNAAELKHVGIMHEIFNCKGTGWEGVYLNYQPTGLGATTKEVTRKDGRKEWVSPLVKAKGKLLYSKGRMGRDFGDKEWEAYGEMVKDEEV